MKCLFGISLCLAAAFTTATAQQSNESETRRRIPPLAIQPTSEALMKAQAAADKAQNKREEQSIEELRKMIEREFAKSASQPLPAPAQEPVTQTIQPRTIPIIDGTNNLVIIDGALYYKIGDSILPMAGGVASGCFSVPDETTSKLEQGKAKSADQNKSGSNKLSPDQEK